MEQEIAPRTPGQTSDLLERQRASKAGSPPTTAGEALLFDYRSPGQLDRDRVYYSESFQRLAYVTQVTAPEGQFVFHNRLGHSLKVAQIGRRIVERLHKMAAEKHIDGAAAAIIATLDPDAVEAGCLAHDLGHPPFGHIAEQELQALTAPGPSRISLPGSFEGNAQSFRIVTQLEQTSSGNGLNLTRQTLDTLLKYPWEHQPVDDGTNRNKKWGFYPADRGAAAWVRKHTPVPADARGVKSLEAHIMDWADDVTYAVHDVQDFYRAGLIPLHQMAPTSVGDVAARSDALKTFEERLKHVNHGTGAPRYTADELASAIEELLSSDIGPISPYGGTSEERRQLLKFGSSLITEFLGSITLSNTATGAVLKIDEGAELKVAALKALVAAFVIEQPSMAEVQHGQRRIVRDLFEHYVSVVSSPMGDRRTLPYPFRVRLEAEEASGQGSIEDKVRLVIDLIAGMTEDGAYRTHNRLFGRDRVPAFG